MKGDRFQKVGDIVPAGRQQRDLCGVDSGPASDDMVLPVDCKQGSDGSQHSVELNLHTDALNVELKTQTSLSDEFVRLETRLEMALQQVSELSARLDAAHYKIGYMEAHLQAKETLLLSLTEQLAQARRLNITEVEEAD